MRWDATKEVTFVWTDRLMPVEEGNEIDDIERRTDLIEAQVILDVLLPKHKIPSRICLLAPPCLDSVAVLRYDIRPEPLTNLLLLFMMRLLTELGRSGRGDSCQQAKAEPAPREVRAYPS